MNTSNPNVADAGGKDYRHVCGGQMMVDGTATRKLPVGFGFGPDGRFRVDAVKQAGYFGACLSCQKKETWYVGKAQLETKHPADINRRIRNQAARERNATLRELCGTSAAAARRDMGMA